VEVRSREANILPAPTMGFYPSFRILKDEEPPRRDTLLFFSLFSITRTSRHKLDHTMIFRLRVETLE
jgi:hypothetical protein